MFKEIRNCNLPDFKASGTLYRHEKTGMEVFHVKNNSNELACCFMFATPSQDDTGVAHIIEHTVLCGSKRYPVKDPFSQVLISSPNTFLNAMTFTDKTIYPFASPLKKDFDILFGIYADAVFDPLLRKQSFEQEGIRFFESSFDGVVFNEMTGALSSADDIAQSKCMRDLYDGTPFMYESGGDPLYIADLTYEEYIKRYKLWYSPSNCRLFLYGDLNVFEYLDKLESLYLNNENCEKYSKKKLTTEISAYKMQDKFNIRRTEFCPQEDQQSVILTWLTTESENMLEVLTLTVLVDILLGNPGAPLYKAITDAGLGEDLSPLSGTDPDFPLMPFIAGYTGAKENSEDEIENFLLSALKKIADEGIDKFQVEAAVKRQEFKLQEGSSTGEPLGITMALRCARPWLRNKNPENALKTSEVLSELKKKIKEGSYFENWIRKNLLENKRRCLLTVKTDKNFNEKLKAEFEKKLALRKKQQENQDFENQKKCFEEFLKKKDSEEDLAKIGRIKISDLPCEIPSYEVKSEKCGNATLVKYNLFSNGIVYLNLAFNYMFLNEEDLKLLPLLLRVMQMTGTDKYDYVALGTQIKYYTGSFSLIHTFGSKHGSGFSGDIQVKTKILREDIIPAMELIGNILKTSRVDDKERIKASLTDLITEFEMNYTYSAHSYASLYAGSQFSISAKQIEITSGTSSWLYLKTLRENETLKDNLAQKLLSLRNRIFTQSNLQCFVGCDQILMPEAVCAAENLILSLDMGLKEENSEFFSKNPEGRKEKAILKLSSGPAYNALSFPLENFSQKELTHATLFSSIVSSGVLWETVRSKNGAYGAYCSVEMQEESMSFVSYRDPQTDLTYSSFTDVFEQKPNKNEIEYSIVTIIGKELRPFTAHQKCNEAFKRFRYNLSKELYLERRKYLMSATPEDLVNVAKKLRENCEKNSYKASVCGAELASSQDQKNSYTVLLPL